MDEVIAEAMGMRPRVEEMRATGKRLRGAANKSRIARGFYSLHGDVEEELSRAEVMMRQGERLSRDADYLSDSLDDLIRSVEECSGSAEEISAIADKGRAIAGKMCSSAADNDASSKDISAIASSKDISAIAYDYDDYLSDYCPCPDGGIKGRTVMGKMCSSAAAAADNDASSKEIGASTEKMISNYDYLSDSSTELLCPYGGIDTVDSIEKVIDFSIRVFGYGFVCSHEEIISRANDFERRAFAGKVRSSAADNDASSKQFGASTAKMIASSTGVLDPYHNIIRRFGLKNTYVVILLTIIPILIINRMMPHP